MCDKLPYSNPRIDKCLITLIDNLNKSTELKTLASCCGHGVYDSTIVVKDKEGNIFEYYSNKFLGTRKRNRYYKKDKNGFYFIPEVSEMSKEKMSLFKKSYLKKLRADLVKEAGGDISDEDWNKVIEKAENDYRKKLQEVVPKAFWFSLFEVAEKGDVIFEIDNVDIGAKIRKLRKEKQKRGKNKIG